MSANGTNDVCHRVGEQERRRWFWLCGEMDGPLFDIVADVLEDFALRKTSRSRRSEAAALLYELRKSRTP